VQTRKLAKSFEHLTGSVALTGPEKFLCKATCDLAIFARTVWINPAVIMLTLYSQKTDLCPRNLFTCSQM